MITDAFMTFLHGLATSVFAFLEWALPAAPGFWVDMTSALSTAFGMIPGPVRYFVPVAPVVTAGVAALGIVVVLGGLRLARRVLSLFTGGGGMA